MDDIAVISKKSNDLISDLKETFDNLRKYNMMLNPKKCVFGVPAGKLLGFIISQRGIEVNPEKIKAILNINRPTCLKDIQRLTGCVAVVSRFVSRLGEKALPLYKLLKKAHKFTWTDEEDAALKKLKEILSLGTYTCSTRAWRAPVNLHGDNQPGNQHRRRGRAEGTRL